MDQPDAFMLMSAQMIGLRWEQGRSAEIVELVLKGQAENPGISGFKPATALVLCDLGRNDEARVLLDEAAREGFDSVPRDNVWSTTLSLWSQVVYELGAREYARQLYDQLSPWRHMMVWNTAIAYNTFDHYLGGLAVTLGEHDRAIDHFRGSIATAERIPAPLWLARTLLWYGRLKAQTGDREGAREALERCEMLAREYGAAGVERAAGEAIEAAATPRT
jgi:tetratricopeptide (TPR) repeat protein